MMPKFAFAAIGAVMPLLAAANAPNFLSLKLSDETAPPGGVAQIQFLVTDPRPIITGMASVSYDSSVVEDFLGISVMSPGGDAVGSASIVNGKLQLRLISPRLTLGTTLDYPIVTMAVRIRPDAAVGSRSIFSLNVDASTFIGLGGSYTFECAPGSITVGGPFSVDNVLPGGGLVPAGTPFTILGTGIGPGFQVKIEGIPVVQVLRASPGSLDVAASVPVRLDGAKVRLRGPKTPWDTYFSYMRAKAIASATSVIPLFSHHTAADAFVIGSSFLALQNPNRDTITVTINTTAGVSTVSLPPGTKLTRAISGNVRVTCDPGVSVMGLTANGNPAPPVVVKAGTL